MTVSGKRKANSGRISNEFLAYLHDYGICDRKTDPQREFRSYVLVYENTSMLRIVPKFDDVVVPIGAAQQCRLRVTPHFSDELFGQN